MKDISKNEMVLRKREGAGKNERTERLLALGARTLDNKRECSHDILLCTELLLTFLGWSGVA